AGDDVRGNGAQVRSISQFEQLLETARAVAKRALLLQLNLDVGKPAFQLPVLCLHLPQAHVAVPHVTDAGDAARDAALNLGEQPERDRLEDRHAATRVDLRGNKDNVPQHYRQEQVSGTEADIDNGHAQYRLTTKDTMDTKEKTSWFLCVLGVLRGEEVLRSCRSIDRDLPEQVEIRQHLSRAEHDRRQRVLGHRERQTGLFAQTLVEVLEHRPSDG